MSKSIKKEVTLKISSSGIPEIIFEVDGGFYGAVLCKTLDVCDSGYEKVYGVINTCHILGLQEYDLEK